MSGGECRESNPDLALTGDNPRPSAPMGQGVVVGRVVLAVSFIPRQVAIARVERRQDSNLHNLAVSAFLITLDRRPSKGKCVARENWRTSPARAVACAGVEPALSRLRDGRRCQLD